MHAPTLSRKGAMTALQSEGVMTGNSAGGDPSVVPTTNELSSPLSNHMATPLVKPTRVVPDCPFSFNMSSCRMPPKAELQPVETFVMTALREQHDSGRNRICAKYQSLLDAFRLKKDVLMLHRILLALRISPTCLHYLTGSHQRHHLASDDAARSSATAAPATQFARFVHMIVKLNPNELEQTDSDNASIHDVGDAQCHLFCALASAQASYLVPILNSLWKQLTFTTSSTIDNLDDQCVQRIHATLTSLLRLCPNARHELSNCLRSNAPYLLRTGADMRWYYMQCLLVTRYAPSLHGMVLELIMDKALEMDVEIKIADGGEATLQRQNESSDELHEEEAIFDLETDNVLGAITSTTPSCELSEGLPTTPVIPNHTVDEMADKLDTLMLLVIEHVERQQDLNGLAQIYTVVAAFFESSVLLTHKSKFVQFLLLHICGLEAQHHDGCYADDDGGRERHDAIALYRDLLGRFIACLIDPYRSSTIRQAAACYLASFVSRAVYVGPATVCESVCVLLRWAEAYVSTLTPDAYFAADVRQQSSLHALFYTVCQSAFYIMCFRGPEALSYYRQDKMTTNAGDNNSTDHVEIDETRWAQLCLHPLQPLRYCLESVRLEFLHVAAEQSLLPPAVLDKLAAQSSTTTMTAAQRRRTKAKIQTAATVEKERLQGGVGGMGHGSNPLDSFFPFDPYLLRESNRCIEPLYRHWGGGDDNDAAMEMSQTDDDMNMQDVDDATQDSDESVKDRDDESNDDDDDDSLQSNVDSRFPSTPDAPVSVHRSHTVGGPPSTTQAVAAQRDALTERWQEQQQRRTRAPSIENGSW